MRVLVIEDDDAMRATIDAALTSAGHEVRSVCDGAAALRLLEAAELWPPEAIVVDLLMPNMDGQTFRRRQLADPRLAPIPTLVITGSSVGVQEREALRDMPILVKPFDPQVLLATLLEVALPRLAVKSCRCGRRFDESAWRNLPRLGEVDNGRHVGERIELRLCVCRSTLAWQVGPHALSIPMLFARPTAKDDGTRS